MNDVSSNDDTTQPTEESTRTATFAGGCFWCMEEAFDQVKGVKQVISGFTGGNTPNPSYDEVATGTTDHVEAVQVHYDPTTITYEEILDVYWHHIDPTDEGGQFADRGSQYTTVIFYHDDEQRRIAEQSKREMKRDDLFQAPIVTEIRPYGEFYTAGDQHQSYYEKNPIQYRTYKKRSGRTDFIEDNWDEPIPADVKAEGDKA